MTLEDHYAALGVSADADAETLRSAWQAGCRVHHPDKGGAAAAFLAVQRAYEVLRDEAQRRAYDAALRAESGAAAPARRAPPAAEDVSLSELSPYADGAWAHPCRCGGVYVLTAADAREGVALLPCSSCSLHVRVVCDGRPGAAQ